MVYPRYSQMFPSLKEVRDSLEQSYFRLQPNIEKEAVDLLMSDQARGVEYLTNYSVDKAQQMLERWKQLGWYLVVKYNDMAVKPEKDGKFLTTPEGLGARVTRVGFPEKTKEMLIEQTGSRFEVPTWEN